MYVCDMFSKNWKKKKNNVTHQKKEKNIIMLIMHYNVKSYYTTMFMLQLVSDFYLFIHSLPHRKSVYVTNCVRHMKLKHS